MLSPQIEDAVARVRILAARGIPEEDLLEHIASSLGRNLSPLAFMTVLREAFGVPLLALRESAEGWVGLDRPGADASSQEVAEVLHAHQLEH